MKNDSVSNILKWLYEQWNQSDPSIKLNNDNQPTANRSDGATAVYFTVMIQMEVIAIVPSVAVESGSIAVEAGSDGKLTATGSREVVGRCVTTH